MRGITLLELIVALALLTVILGVSGLAVASLRPPPQSEQLRALRQARTQAIRSGAPVQAVMHNAPRSTHLLFLPDGRAVGDSVDPLTGRFGAR